uniref:Uncharacterized protein n=1 Tax=uncultured bacterium contig00076 TaxID=1181554 RepID=A0A806K1H0_9BACT|nr:hypothetical protein [uncultured bacterium contig00076]
MISRFCFGDESRRLPALKGGYNKTGITRLLRKRKKNSECT